LQSLFGFDAGLIHVLTFGQKSNFGFEEPSLILDLDKNLIVETSELINYINRKSTDAKLGFLGFMFSLKTDLQL
jgi:hypothetical protein